MHIICILLSNNILTKTSTKPLDVINDTTYRTKKITMRIANEVVSYFIVQKIQTIVSNGMKEHIRIRIQRLLHIHLGQCHLKILVMSLSFH